jgi:hypothetical protein
MKNSLKQIGIESGLLFQRAKLSYEEQRFAELIIDRCCAHLLQMHDNAASQHNFYKHAAIMLKQSFESK